jgi:hypothetical protein
MGSRIRNRILPGLLVLAGLTGLLPGRAQEPTTGWACGTVADETLAFVVGADLTLLPAVEAGAGEPEPVQSRVSDDRGSFCFREIPPGHYQLRVSQTGWPLQPLHPVEIRAGLLNRLHPLEMELEPGEPRVSYAESLDGMPTRQARSMFERFLLRGEAANPAELARRLLPKRGPEIDLGPLALGVDPKPLVDELLRILDGGYLPPLKTARYLYVVGELADARTRNRVVPLLLDKLRDARPLPVSPLKAATESSSKRYVSDIAMFELVRQAGEDFGWKYGRPPIQNGNGIERAQGWWRREIEKTEENR